MVGDAQKVIVVAVRAFWWCVLDFWIGYWIGYKMIGYKMKK